MYDPDDLPDSRRQRGEEYQDYHFHDDDETVPTDNEAPRKLAAPRKPNRRPPPRRHYDED